MITPHRIVQQITTADPPSWREICTASGWGGPLARSSGQGELELQANGHAPRHPHDLGHAVSHPAAVNPLRVRYRSPLLSNVVDRPVRDPTRITVTLPRVLRQPTCAVPRARTRGFPGPVQRLTRRCMSSLMERWACSLIHMNPETWRGEG